MAGLFAIALCHSLLYSPALALDPVFSSSLHPFPDRKSLFVLKSCFGSTFSIFKALLCSYDVCFETLALPGLFIVARL